MLILLWRLRPAGCARHHLLRLQQLHSCCCCCSSDLLLVDVSLNCCLRLLTLNPPSPTVGHSAAATGLPKLPDSEKFLRISSYSLTLRPASW